MCGIVQLSDGLAQFCANFMQFFLPLSLKQVPLFHIFFMFFYSNLKKQHMFMGHCVGGSNIPYAAPAAGGLPGAPLGPAVAPLQTQRLSVKTFTTPAVLSTTATKALTSARCAIWTGPINCFC